MKKLIFAFTCLISSSVFAIGDTDSFRSTSGLIVRIGDTKAELVEKMQIRQRPVNETIYDHRGFPMNVEVYTFNIETMIYKVYLFRGKIFKMTSDYS